MEFHLGTSQIIGIVGAIVVLLVAWFIGESRE